MVLLPLLLAQAGWYNPDKVASNSETFKRYADDVQPKAQAMEASLARASQQIQELDLGVTLLGGRAPEELVAYRDELRKQYAHQGLEAQSFNDWLQEVSSSVFTQALDFAIEDLDGWEIEECAPRAGGIAGMTGPGAMGGGVSCEGEDVSVRLASSLDGNGDLNGVVDQLMGESWPNIGLTGRTWAPVELTGRQGYVRVAPLAEALVGATLEKLGSDFDREVTRVLEGGEGKKALKEADALRKRYEADVAAQGERVFAAVAKVAGDWKLGLCANPPELGGCEGEDRSAALIPELASNKKVLKALK